MKRAWVALGAVLAIGLAAKLLVPAILNAGGPANPRFAMNALATQLSEQYHQCVPLGWNPQPIASSYYPAYSREYRENAVWLHPYWLGLVRRSELTDPNVRLAYNVMNTLVRAGMLERTIRTDGLYYRLTVAALRYYFENNRYGNNPDHLPYLCYSRLIPQRVLFSHRLSDGAFRVAFDRRAGTIAPWAKDPSLQDHSIMLPRRVDHRIPER